MIQDRQLIITNTATRVMAPKAAPKEPAGAIALRALVVKGHTPAEAMKMLERKSGHRGQVPESKRVVNSTAEKPRRSNLKATSAPSIILGMLSDTPSKIGKPLAFAAGLSVDTIYRAIADLKAAGQIVSGPYDNGKPTYLLTDAGKAERLRRFGA